VSPLPALDSPVEIQEAMPWRVAIWEEQSCHWNRFPYQFADEAGAQKFADIAAVQMSKRCKVQRIDGAV
jgi:hypothetical protein